MKKVHLMGIGGSAMVALARLFKEKGHEVQGSDQKVYPPASDEIHNLGIKFFEGYRPENMHPHPDLVVVGNVIPKSNAEAQELLKLGLDYLSMPEALRKFFLQGREGVMVTGTHGKTTTTAMMSWIFQCMGKEPGYFLGGVPKNFQVSSRRGKGTHFVVEGDEYDTAFFEKTPKFLHYGIENVILTSMEFDHADIYADFRSVQKEFTKLVEGLSSRSNLVACGDHASVREVASRKSGKAAVFYGEGPENNWILKDFEFSNTGTSYEISGPGFSKKVENSPLLGRYNALNHLAVIAMSFELGLDVDKARVSIESFEGVRRRQERIAEKDGVLFFEDFAHHPTAIRETLHAFEPLAQKRGGKLIAVLEPRSNTLRRKIFQDALPEALEVADCVILTPVYIKQDTLRKEDELDTKILCGNLKQAIALESYEELFSSVLSRVRENDVVVFMSNGDFRGEIARFKKL